MQYSALLERLQNLINYTPSQAELCKITDVKQSTMGNRQTRDSQFSDDEIQKINDYYGIDIYKGNTKSDITLITLDYFPDFLVSCGNGIFSLDETKEKITVPKEFIKGYSPAQKYFIVIAFSDSMQPEIKEKDMLIVRMANGENIMDNHIYMFRHDGRFYCKYLSYNLGQVIVRSLNPEYPTRYIEKEDLQNFELIGEIVGLMREIK